MNVAVILGCMYRCLRRVLNWQKNTSSKEKNMKATHLVPCEEFVLRYGDPSRVPARRKLRHKTIGTIPYSSYFLESRLLSSS